MNTKKTIGEVLVSLGLIMGWSGAPARANAAELMDPPVMCGPDANCNEAMKSISGDFDRLLTPPDLTALPAVYSGECYYLNFGTDPDVTQYGVELFEQQDGAPVGMGLLSFFASPNPYQGMTLDQIRALLTREGAPPAPVKAGPKFAEVDFLSATGSIRYWFKQDLRTHELLEVALWNLMGGSGRTISKVFCRLPPNS